MSANIIYHTAKVLSVDNDSVKVLIERGSACETCYNRGACGAFEKKEMIYDIKTDESNRFSVGETVRVGIATNTGLKAVVYAYILPMVVFVVAFLIAYLLSAPDWLSALIGIAVLAVYYILLAKYRNKLEKEFTFTIEKIINI